MNIEVALRMSVLNAILEVAAKLNDGSNVPFQDMPRILRAGRSTEATFDYDVALEILEMHPTLAEVACLQRRDAFRRILQQLLLAENPAWMRLIPLGRRVLRRSLNNHNALQCFHSAGLFDQSEDAFAWWDHMSTLVRRVVDSGRTVSGRTGEQLSVEHEVRRLADEGAPHLIPIWESREDETLGYDIQSFTVSYGDVRTLLIEAKACSSEPLVFHVSQKEWKIAESRPESYLFHVWHLPSTKVTKISPHQLADHIPKNRGDGVWESVEITWKGRVICATPQGPDFETFAGGRISAS